MKPTVVIPAYNEARTIGDVIARCLAVVERVIVVDDGSSDDTAGICESRPVELIRQPANRGKASAMVAGFARALTMDADVIVTLDGDGQHRPEDIPLLLDRARRRPGEIVIASRLADSGGFPRERYLGNRIADFWISWACGYRVEDSQSGFRLYPREVLERVRPPHGPGQAFVFESEMLIDAARAGFKSTVVAIPALYEGTLERPSHFHPFREVPRIIRMVAWKLISRGLYPRGLWALIRG